MKCLILAAGYATRLYPLTENYPKPLLKVGRKAIIDWLIEDIASTGAVDEYVVISNHRFVRFFEEWANEHTLPIIVVDDGTNSNDTRLGAVRDIQFAIEMLGLDDDMLVIAGDNILDFSLKCFIEFACEKGTSCVMHYRETDVKRLTRSCTSEIDASGRMISLVEKPENPVSEWCTPPFYYYTRADAAKIRDAIADGCGNDAPGSLAAWMCLHSVVYSMEMPGKRYDIGDLKSYMRVQEEYRVAADGINVEQQQ